jgi:hypothetical protein
MIPAKIINEVVDWGVAAWADKPTSVGLAEMLHGIFALANQRHKEAITAGHRRGFDIWWAEFGLDRSELFTPAQLKMIRKLAQFAFQEGALFSENA